jgi:capsular exopolysaccharide synthesis family protein
MSRLADALNRAHQDVPPASASLRPEIPAAELPLPDAYPAEPEAPPRTVPPDGDRSEAASGRTGESASRVPTAAPDDQSLFEHLQGRDAAKLVVMPGRQPLPVEQYRKLTATLHQAQQLRHVKVVMVASAIQGEGKTLTASNLALTLSESYERQVLLVDADLRRPSLHEVFHLPNAPGLTEGLKAGTSQKLRVHRVSSHLSVLTAGVPDRDPMSGLTSTYMRQLVDEAAARFDWVLIDTPPVGLMPDAKLLAELTDCIVLVIQAARTPYDIVHRTIDALGRERIIGVVLNRMDERAIPGGNADYGYYGYQMRDAAAKTPAAGLGLT